MWKYTTYRLSVSSNYSSNYSSNQYLELVKIELASRDLEVPRVEKQREEIHGDIPRFLPILGMI